MLIEKLPIFLVNTFSLSQFHKHSFTPYPSLSGQVGIISIPSKNANRKITNLSGKHSFTLLFSYKRIGALPGRDYVLTRKVIQII
jgi:hypothetical protein